MEVSSQRVSEKESKLTRCALAVIGILAAVGLGCSRPPREPYALRWKFQKGAVYRIEIEQSGRTEIKKGGTTEHGKIQQVLTMVWSTDSVDDAGNAWISLKFDRLRMTEVKDGRKQVEYDSRSAEKPEGKAAEFAERFRGLFDVSLGVQISPRGEILKVTRSREFEGPAGLDARRLTSKSGLTGLLTVFTGVFPERKLRTGDSWEWSSTRSLLERSTLTYTYNGLHRHSGQPLARIDFSPHLESSQPPGGEAKATEPKVEAVSWFDPSAGLLKEAVIHMTIERTTPDKVEQQKAELSVKWTLTTD